METLCNSIVPSNEKEQTSDPYGNAGPTRSVVREIRAAAASGVRVGMGGNTLGGQKIYLSWTNGDHKYLHTQRFTEPYTQDLWTSPYGSPIEKKKKREEEGRNQNWEKVVVVEWWVESGKVTLNRGLKEGKARANHLAGINHKTKKNIRKKVLTIKN